MTGTATGASPTWSIGGPHSAKRLSLPLRAQRPARAGAAPHRRGHPQRSLVILAVVPGRRCPARPLWVALWYPLDTLLWYGRPLTREIRVLRAMRPRTSRSAPSPDAESRTRHAGLGVTASRQGREEGTEDGRREGRRGGIGQPMTGPRSGSRGPIHASVTSAFQTGLEELEHPGGTSARGRSASRCTAVRRLGVDEAGGSGCRPAPTGRRGRGGVVDEMVGGSDGENSAGAGRQVGVERRQVGSRRSSADRPEVNSSVKKRMPSTVRMSPPVRRRALLAGGVTQVVEHRGEVGAQGTG